MINVFCTWSILYVLCFVLLSVCMYSAPRVRFSTIHESESESVSVFIYNMYFASPVFQLFKCKEPHCIYVGVKHDLK
jgi:hypothetical protein